MGIYLRAMPGEYAERVLVAGDPGRVMRVARLLDNYRMVTEHRGLVGFTGSYRGVAVSVQTTGMGCPSMAIVGEELLAYGVRRVVRIGTCSGFGAGVRNGHVIVVTGAAAADGTTRSYTGGNAFAAVPDFELTVALVAAMRARRIPMHIGPVVTVDVEPPLDEHSAGKWREYGLLAMEMESAALFYLALRATSRGPQRVEAGCVLTVSDGWDGHCEGAQVYMSDQDLDSAADQMHVAALDAIAGPFSGREVAGSGGS
ncbi:MAG: purine-nucleoside phosphorylase [Actinomycetota bacterium]|jgi:DeoD family purine-nucleoside phosphorylase|nr:purine-nucleoside phosphorylase [Actinomycetota bacterium]